MIEDQEYEYIAHEMTVKNLPDDLAMMFVTQAGFTMDHLFAAEMQAKPNFYVKVWKQIAKYTEQNLHRGRFQKILHEVLTKCWIGEYDTTIACDGFVIRHGYIVQFLEWFLGYLHEHAMYQDMMIAVDYLCSITELPENVVFSILYLHPEWCTDEILSDIIRQEYLDDQKILRLLIKKRETTTLSVLQDLILSIFRNREQLFRFVQTVRAQYRIEVQEKGKHKILLMEPYWGTKEEREILEEIRLYLRDLIFTDAEIDLYEFLELAYLTHTAEQDFVLANIYQVYLQWMASNGRQQDRLGRYLYYEYEDRFHPEIGVADETLALVSKDVMLWNYLYQIPILDAYGSFIRAFNANRMVLCCYNNRKIIYEYLCQAAELYPEFIPSAVDDEMYYFLTYDGK